MVFASPKTPKRQGANSQPFGAGRMEAEKPKTLGEEAYRYLRQDILSGRLAPETKLRFRELRDRYGIGLAGLREALSRLASDRLVAFEPLRGYRVAPISLEELRDISALRIDLSIRALHDSIDRGDAAWEAEILASLHRLVRCPLPLSLDDFAAIEEWEKKHEEFHRSLLAACGSPWTLHFCSILSFQFERYRRHILLGMAGSNETAGRIDHEHEQIARTIVSRNKEAACRLLALHFQGSLKYYVEHYPDRKLARTQRAETVTV